VTSASVKIKDLEFPKEAVVLPILAPKEVPIPKTNAVKRKNRFFMAIGFLV
jgi:hypothetical protein